MDKEIKIDDEALAKDAVINSPEVTHRELEETKAEIVPHNERMQEPVIDEGRAERDSTIMQTGIANAYEQFSGEEFNNDQKYMLSAFGRELFVFMQGRNIPAIGRIGILGFCCFIPFLPLIFKLKKESGE